MKKLSKVLVFIFTLVFLSFQTATPALAATLSDSYADTSKINTGASSNYQVTGGQLNFSHATPNISWWKLDEASGTSVADSVGSNTLTATGGNVSSVKYGNARSFNGTSDYIQMSPATGISNFTITAWVYPSALGGVVFMQGTTAADHPYFQFSLSATGTLTFASRNDANTEQNASVNSTATVTAGQWNFVAITKSSGTITYYVNGASTGATVATAGTYNNWVYGVIGALKRNTTTTYYNGLIDDVRVYNYARSSGQITEDMNNSSITGNAAVGWWKLDETSGPTVADSSASGFTGTALGPTTGWWKLDEASGNVADSSGNSNTGTPAGTTVVSGTYGNARTFNGTTDYISVSGSAGLLNLQSDFSMEAWVNLNSTSECDLYVQANTGTNTAFGRILTSGGNLYYNFRNDASTEISNSISGVTNSTWHHVALTKSGTTFTLYLNGSGTPFTSTMPSTPMTFNNSAIGAMRRLSPTGYCNGVIDDVRIYNYARSASQIYDDKNYYNAGPHVMSVKYNNARYFNGTTDYLACTDANCGGTSKLDIGTVSSTSFSWGAWFNTTASGTQVMVSKKTNTGTAAGYMLQQNASNQTTCRIADGTTNVAVAYSDVSTNDGQWHHAFCTVDGTNIKIFVDGQERNSASITSVTGSADNAIDLRVGGQGNGSNSFSGLIDDVRVYNYARDQSQIQADMNESYNSTATIVSTNLLLGISSITGIDEFVYNLTKPSGTTATVQFSQDGSAWYNSSGTGGSDTLTQGTNTIVIHSLGWSGANFYYKIAFGGDGTDTPVLDDVAVNYTISNPTCSPSPGGNLSIPENCYLPITGVSNPLYNVDGVDNGDMTIQTYKTLTIKGDQQIARNNGKSVIIQNGGSIAINDMTSGSGGNVRDYSGNGNEGTAVGATVVSGKYGYARSFDGASYVTVGNLGSFPAQGTIELWINASAMENYRSPLATKYNGGNAGIRFEENASGNFLVVVGNDAQTYTVGTYFASGMQINTWYHIALTWNTSTNQMTGYLNGNVAFGPTANTYWPTTIPDLRFGTGFSTDAARQWKGLVDDIRFYDYVRSDTQITADKDNAPNPSGDGPIAWWRFEDGGQLKETNLWVQDTDGDGWSVMYKAQRAQNDTPGTGWSRRYLMIGDALGDARDGTIIFGSNTNLNTDYTGTRTCADAISYSVTALSTNTATLSTTPAAGCLAAGDYILVANLKGISSAYPNVGNYEMLIVSSVSTNTVTFTTNKKKYYGNGASDDTNLGTTSGTNQIVLLQRVPQYGDVTVNNGVTLTANAWDETKGGVLAFVAKGTVTVTGSISMNGLGYNKGNGGGTNGGGKGGYTYNGLGTDGAGQCPGSSAPTAHQGGGGGGGTRTGSCPDDVRGGGPGGIGGGGGGGGDSGGAGGGGAYGGVGKSGSSNSTDGSGTTGGAGASSSTDGGAGGGGLYGSADLSSLFLGSGGGGEGSGSSAGGSGGGKGAGIVLIYANTLSVTGSITANGNNGLKNNYNSAYGGGGAGGSTKIMGISLTLGSSLITATGGTGDVGGVYGHGGVGRVAAWGNSASGTTNPSYTTISGP